MNLVGFVLPAVSIGLGSLLTKPQRGFFPTAQTDSSGQVLSPAAPIIAQAVIEERHIDELEITEHPVEQGAAITDHAFKRPAQVTIFCGWSNSPSVAGGIGGLIDSAVAGAAAVAGIPRSLSRTVLLGSSLAAGIQTLLKGDAVDQVKSIYEKLLALQASRQLFTIYTGKRKYENMLFASLGTHSDAKEANSLMIIAQCKQVILVTTQTVTAPIKVSAQARSSVTSPLSRLGQKGLGIGLKYVPPDITSTTGRLF